MAEIELASRMEKKDLKEISRLAVAYFKRFGSKAVCFGDIKAYIDPSIVSTVLNGFENEIPKDPKEKVISFFISILTICRKIKRKAFNTK